jgi:hypothetical protein
MITRNSMARVAAAAVAGALWLGATTAHAAPVRLAGTDVVGSHVSAASPGGAEVYRTTASSNGTVTSLALHLDAGSDATALELGLYADAGGQPTTLLTSGRTDSPAAGWNQVAVPAAALEAGKAYWIALLNPADAAGTLRWTDRAGAGDPGEQGSGTPDLTTLPDTWVTGGIYGDGPLSAHVLGEASAPTLTVTPSALSFWATRGAGSPVAKTLEVGGSSAYSATENAPWLSIASASRTVTVKVDASGLAAGTYTANVRVTASGAEPRDVPVTLTVNPAASGLVGAWAFEEASGDTANDSSGRRNAGALQGASRTSAGVYGRGVAFDGTDDWITVADNASLDLTSGMTLEAWVKPDRIDTNWRTILIKEQPDQLSYALYANTDQGRPSGNVFTSGDNGLAGPAPLPAERWSHVATTFDGTTLRLFVDGAQTASMAVPGPIKVSGGALRIGGNAVWGEWFDGTIDEVRVYNRALSAEEVLADRDTPIAKSSGNSLSPAEKLKALLMKLLARWKKHWGEWSWHGHRGYFHGGR